MSEHTNVGNGQTEDHPGTVDFILERIKGDRFKDAMGQTAEEYVAYSLGQSAHLYHAEGFDDVAMERDQAEAWNKRLVAAMREAVGTMQRQMMSDDSTDAPFNEDMADAIRRCEDVLRNG